MAREIVQLRSAPVISVFLPPHAAGAQALQDAIRLKSLLGSLASGAHQVASLATAIAAQFAATDVRRHATDSLACFAAVDGVRIVRVAYPLQEGIVVAPRPHLLPLAPTLQGDGAFFVLELHQHGIRLHEGSRFGLKEIIVHGFSGTAEVHQHRRVDHAEASRVVPASSDQHHSHGVHASVHAIGSREHALAYFRAVEALLAPVLGAATAPLLLTGVAWLQALYAEVNHYRPLVPDGIASDTTVLGTAELHALAWSIVAPRFAQPAREAIEQHAQVEHLGRISHRPTEVLERLMEGRVSSLLIAADMHGMGTVDATQALACEHAPAQPGDEDLANAAFVLAYRQPIPVFVVERAAIHGGTGVSACLRY